MTPRAVLRRLFDAAVDAVGAERVLPPCLPDPPAGRTLVVGFGKAAAAMARALEARWAGPLDGFAVTRYGHGVPCRRIEVVEAGHPVPDAAGLAAGARALDLAAGLGPDDLLICLASGGGSALLSAPAPGVAFADKRRLTRALLACGADIGEINCVRKHLSAVKGGRLAAAAAPADVVTLAVSDVAGDAPETIASGPAVADPTTCADALAILDRRGVAPGPAVRRRLADPAAETPKALVNARFRLAASAADALAGAAAEAARLGLAARCLGAALTGEAAALGRAHAGLAAGEGVWLSGGEATVTLGGPGRGRGGPNAEYLLALAVVLDGRPGVHAIACDTDGIDGTEDNAGAAIGPDTLARARAAGLDPAAALAAHRSYDFFAALGDLVVTGPTRTNVNDFRAILVEPGA